MAQTSLFVLRSTISDGLLEGGWFFFFFFFLGEKERVWMRGEIL